MSIQIPNLHTSNRTQVNVREGATVFIARRKDAAPHAGTFKVKGILQFNPATDAYPSGTMKIDVDLNDSVQAVFTITTVEQLDTTGKATPTAYASGRCTADLGPKQAGLRYWIMFCDNKSPNDKETPDIISFLIFDRAGKRVAYGTGPVVEGDDFAVAGTAE